MYSRVVYGMECEHTCGVAYGMECEHTCGVVYGMECDCISRVVGDVLVWNNVMWSVDLH